MQELELFFDEPRLRDTTACPTRWGWLYPSLLKVKKTL